jgi:hypothetical protein
MVGLKDMEEKSAVNSIVEQMKKEGFAYIEGMLADKHGENVLVDFKLTESADYTSKKSLMPSDWRNLARAISGFGNSEGGLIIWGVNSRKDMDGSNDYIKNIVPIKNPENLRSLIESSISLCTLPYHNLVESFVLKKKKTDVEGVVVTIIPKSNNRPIQNIFEKDNRYYLRVGDSFQSITDSFIRGLIGTNPQPEVGFMYTIGTPKIESPTGRDKRVSFDIGLVGVNFGVGIARDIYGHTRCFVKGGSEVGLQLNDIKNYDYQQAFGIEYSFMSKSDFRLGFQQRSQMLVMTFMLQPPFTGDLVVDLLISANGQYPSRKYIEISDKEIKEFYEKMLANPSQDELSKFWENEK